MHLFTTKVCCSYLICLLSYTTCISARHSHHRPLHQHHHLHKAQAPSIASSTLAEPTPLPTKPLNTATMAHHANGEARDLQALTSDASRTSMTLDLHLSDIKALIFDVIAKGTGASKRRPHQRRPNFDPEDLSTIATTSPPILGCRPSGLGSLASGLFQASSFREPTSGHSVLLKNTSRSTTCSMIGGKMHTSLCTLDTANHSANPYASKGRFQTKS